MIRRIVLIWGALSIPLFAQSADQPSTNEKIRELQEKIGQMNQELQELKAAERNKQLKEAALAEKSAAGAAVAADTTGFTITSTDRNFKLKIGADLQVDGRSFTGSGAAGTTDQILLRRVRPTFSGTVYKYVDFFFRPDFGQGTTIIYDAYLQLNYFSHAKLRVGKFKPPVGLERLQSDDDTSFIERGLPTLLVPSRDIGYQVSGDIMNRRATYTVGVFNGVPDNGLSDASPSSHRDYAGNLFLTPFLPDENFLSGLGVGLGTSGGNVDGSALPSYKTVGQTSFFAFNSGVTSAGHRTRLAPQVYYYLGPFGLLSEYTVSEEEFQKGAVRKDVALRAWQVEGSYILTGEQKGFTSPAPRHPFDPFNGGWGAIELAVRVGNFRAGNALFNYGFADPTKTPREAREWLGGVNWYLNRLVRISLDYGATNFGGGAPNNGNRLMERVILSRFQINFI